MSISSWIVRRVTYQAWNGSGWPQWILADESTEAQNEEPFFDRRFKIFTLKKKTKLMTELKVWFRDKPNAKYSLLLSDWTEYHTRNFRRPNDQKVCHWRKSTKRPKSWPNDLLYRCRHFLGSTGRATFIGFYFKFEWPHVIKLLLRVFWALFKIKSLLMLQ